MYGKVSNRLLPAGINFIIDKINWIIQQYNDIAASGLGSFAGLDTVDLIQRVELNSAAAARNGTVEGSVRVEVSGKIEGASGEVNTVSSGLVDTGGSNHPLE